MQIVCFIVYIYINIIIFIDDYHKSNCLKCDINLTRANIINILLKADQLDSKLDCKIW